MNRKQNRYPLIKLPADNQITLYLIREELKSRKLFHTLHKVGLDDCYFQPHLDSLILYSIGLDENDETYSVYNHILEKRSHKIEADNESVMKHAMKVYSELLNAKRELSRKNVAA